MPGTALPPGAQTRWGAIGQGSTAQWLAPTSGVKMPVSTRSSLPQPPYLQLYQIVTVPGTQGSDAVSQE